MNVDLLKLVKKLDADFWNQYITEVEPSDMEYLTYQRWLCYKLHRIHDLAQHLEKELAE